VDVNVALASQLLAQDYADLAPTPAMLAGLAKTCAALGTTVRNWQRVVTRDVAAFSAVLRRNQMANVLATPSPVAAPECGG